MRGDDGKENNFVDAACRVLTDAGFPSTYIRGKSVHNQRIERLWVDIMPVRKRIITLLDHIETDDTLDLDDPVHRFALDFVYLPILNTLIRTWVFLWNNHTMRTTSESRVCEGLQLRAR